MPTQQYRTRDGQRVPGVTTILGKFKDPGGLMHWAWTMGVEGKDYRQVRDDAASAGTLAHAMVERWIKGQPEPAPSAPPEIVERAARSFGAFREWAEQTKLVVTHTEVPLVSERHRFGGCLDAILVQGKRAMGDWKTSTAIYAENLMQVAGYGILWEENFPDEPITGGYHILRFDKEFGDFSNRWWQELDAAKRGFLALRAAYEELKELNARAK